ncbi:hypothetical protein ABXK61_17815 [Burkholderia sola]|uniref:hypothetical protein n=1 Tax=Burkholderia TaxID=32008 RepID=UPI001AE85D6D|nr:hypothetical protein [Burkholderia sp. AcTa6-5]MBP0715159.1 hypothetical protein [Burkholderia sp. AcTa6-5]
MNNIDYIGIQAAMARLPSDHDASGAHRPTVSEIFTPRQHAFALDPDTPVVVGARGSGKSFWAGVLQHDDTRNYAALAYPQVDLDSVIVEAGYTGIASEGGVTSRNIDARVPAGQEAQQGFEFWQSVIIRAAKRATDPDTEQPTLRDLMTQYADPEDADRELSRLDRHFASDRKTLIVTFDALDTISTEWKRSRKLLDALFEVIWSLRARRAIRGKVFIRPEQFNDETLRFVELPKLRSMRIELVWTKEDLYGMMFSQLLQLAERKANRSLIALASEADADYPADMRTWFRKRSLYADGAAQQRMMVGLAGLYMGRGAKKGGTYDWPYNHLGDAHGRVTPRSFMKLFAEAGKYPHTLSTQAISADGIRHGLREASRVRVDQLVLEYPWIKRAIAPLAGVTVPCEPTRIYELWEETKTVNTILKAAKSETTGFLPPFEFAKASNPVEALALAMENIGVLSFRNDGRIDMPDLFRVAALMLKRGATPPLKNPSR